MKVRYSNTCGAAQRLLIGLVVTATVAVYGVTVATGAGAAASKPAVRVMLIGQLQATQFSLPEMEDGAKAAAAALGKGKNGLKIQVDVCNDQGDPNVATTCARQAVTNKDVAVVGGLTLFGATMFPILEAAKIPYIGNFPIVDKDFQSPMAFPIDGGSPVSLVATMAGAKQIGCTKVGSIVSDVASARDQQAFTRSAAKLNRQTVVAEQDVDNLAPDMSPAVATVLAAGAECILVYNAAAAAAKTVGAIAQSSKPKTPIVSSTGIIGPQLIQALGAAAEGITLSSQAYDAASTNSAPFRADMTAYNPKASQDTFSQGAWSSVQAFAQVAKKVNGPITSAALLKLLPKTTVDLPTYPAPISFATNKAVPKFPHLFNTKALLYTVKNGQLSLSSPTPVETKSAIKAAG